MGRSNIASWEETVFEHRNRDYGAYLLRYSYPIYLTVSALIVIFLFLSGMIGLQISKGKKAQVQAIKRVRVINYSELSAPPPIEKIYVPPKPKEVVVEKVKIEKYVAPVVVQEEVEEPDEMMTMEEVKENPASTDNTIEASDGVDTIFDMLPALSAEVEVVVEPVFTGKPPEFPGGEAALSKWLKENLKYPLVAKRMGIEGKVVVEFIVGEDGRISDARVKESLHRRCDKEAIRLVKSMPAWTPGESDGLKVVVMYKLPIPFVLSKD